MPTNTPRRQALIARIRDAREHPQSPFDRHLRAAVAELRAARDRVLERHGVMVTREAEREVYGRP